MCHGPTLDDIAISGMLHPLVGMTIKTPMVPGSQNEMDDHNQYQDIPCCDHDTNLIHLMSIDPEHFYIFASHGIETK